MQNTAYIIEYKCLRQLVAKKKKNSNKSCSKYGAEVENDARSVGELQRGRNCKFTYFHQRGGNWSEAEVCHCIMHRSSVLKQMSAGDVLPHHSCHALRTVKNKTKALNL